MTLNQESAFDAYHRDEHLFMLGSPGTGKTFLAVYLALAEVMERRSLKRRLVIVRSALSTREIGFLPGDEKRKLEVYEAPYRDACTQLFGRGDAYEVLKQRGIVEFHSTSFLRGTTLDDSVILFDECQNTTLQEWFTVLSRVGENSRVVVCGDVKQDDLTSERYKTRSGVGDLIRVFSEMNGTSLVEFGVDDVVRGGFTRELIKTMDRLGL